MLPARFRTEIFVGASAWSGTYVTSAVGDRIRGSDKGTSL
jgi:hypothetical protein